MKLYAMPDNWFDPGTEVKCLAECGTVYSRDGIPSLHMLCLGYKNGVLDEEMCNSEEFAMVADDYFPEDDKLNDRN